MRSRMPGQENLSSLPSPSATDDDVAVVAARAALARAIIDFAVACVGVWACGRVAVAAGTRPPRKLAKASAAATMLFRCAGDRPRSSIKLCLLAQARARVRALRALFCSHLCDHNSHKPRCEGNGTPPTRAATGAAAAQPSGNFCTQANRVWTGPSGGNGRMDVGGGGWSVRLVELQSRCRCVRRSSVCCRRRRLPAPTGKSVRYVSLASPAKRRTNRRRRQRVRRQSASRCLCARRKLTRPWCGTRTPMPLRFMNDTARWL